MQPSTLAKRAWLLIILAVIAFYLYGLGHLPFVGPDEPRYAEVAREMYLRGDLITPTLGGHPWFEKPALLYWMIIAGFSLFGVSEWAARLGPAICGLGTVAAVFWIGRSVCSRSETELGGLGLCSALIAASMGSLVAFSHVASFDIVVTMTMTIALACFIRGELETENTRRRLLAAFYAFVGASLLAKGLVGIVIPFGVVLVYYLLRRRWPERTVMLSLLWGGPIALAVAAIWYAPVIARNGWPFIDQFFIQHHFARYVSNKYRHPQPIYFYLIVVVLLSLPWTAFLFDALPAMKRWQWRTDRPEDKFRVFALAWLLVPILFFSFSGSKLPGYILPALPAAALLAGERLRHFNRSARTSAWPMGLTGGILILMGSAAIISAEGSLLVPLRWVVPAMAPLIIVGFFCLFFARHRTLTPLAVVCVAFIVPVIALNSGLANLANRESSRDLIHAANGRGYGSAPIYGLNEIDRTAEFYAAGRVVYGTDREPVRFDDASVALKTVERTHEPILVLVPLQYPDQLIKLTAAGAEVIGDNGRYALVAVRPR